MEPQPKPKKLRHKVKKSVRAATKKADKKIFKELVKAASEALIRQEIDIVLSFPYFCKFPKGWPKGILMKKTPTANIYRIKVRKLLDWLHKEGHSPYNSRELIVTRYRMEKHLDKLEKWFEGDFDLGEYDVDIHDVDSVVRDNDDSIEE